MADLHRGALHYTHIHTYMQGKFLTVESKTTSTSADLREASFPWQSFSKNIWRNYKILWNNLFVNAQTLTFLHTDNYRAASGKTDSNNYVKYNLMSNTQLLIISFNGRTFRPEGLCQLLTRTCIAHQMAFHFQCQHKLWALQHHSWKYMQQQCSVCVHVVGMHWAHGVSLCNYTKELDYVGVTELRHDMSLLEKLDPLFHHRIDAERLDRHLSHLRALAPRSLVYSRKLPTAALIQDAAGGQRTCMQQLHPMCTSATLRWELVWTPYPPLATPIDHLFSKSGVPPYMVEPDVACMLKPGLVALQGESGWNTWPWASMPHHR